MEVAHIDAFHRDTRRFWQFYRPRFAELGEKRPNRAHEILAELECRGRARGRDHPEHRPPAREGGIRPGDRGARLDRDLELHLVLDELRARGRRRALRPRRRRHLRLLHGQGEARRGPLRRAPPGGRDRRGPGAGGERRPPALHRLLARGPPRRGPARADPLGRRADRDRHPGPDPVRRRGGGEARRRRRRRARGGSRGLSTAPRPSRRRGGAAGSARTARRVSTSASRRSSESSPASAAFAAAPTSPRRSPSAARSSAWPRAGEALAVGEHRLDADPQPEAPRRGSGRRRRRRGRGGSRRWPASSVSRPPRTAAIRSCGASVSRRRLRVPARDLDRVAPAPVGERPALAEPDPGGERVVGGDVGEERVEGRGPLRVQGEVGRSKRVAELGSRSRRRRRAMPSSHAAAALASPSGSGRITVSIGHRHGRLLGMRARRASGEAFAAVAEAAAARRRPGRRGPARARGCR